MSAVRRRREPDDAKTDRDGRRGSRLLLLGSLVLVLALAGCASTEEEARETGEAEVAFDFEGIRDAEPQRTEHVVTYDPDDRPTMQLYEGTDAHRPDSYTLHDLLADLEEDSELTIEVEHANALGYQLTSVDGVPEPQSTSFWGLYVDGERETAGIGTIPVEEGSTYEWRLHDRSDDQQEETDTDGSPSSSDGDAGSEGSTGADGSSDASDATSEATMIVDYNGFRDEDPQRTEDVVSYDPDARPTMHRYEGGETDRADAYILHDLVSDWSNQTGVDHIAREDADTGYRLQSVDGVTAHSTQGGAWTWQLAVDGEEETASLNAVEVEANATYEWTFQRTSRR